MSKRDISVRTIVGRGEKIVIGTTDPLIAMLHAGMEDCGSHEAGQWMSVDGIYIRAEGMHGTFPAVVLTP